MAEEMKFEDQELEETVVTKRRKLLVDKRDVAISELYGRFTKGKLILQPEFQRRYVWDDKKASRLVESVLLNVPIPVIYFAEEDGRWEVIDGQQRLVSLFRFYNPLRIGESMIDKLRIGRRTIFEDLSGKSFGELPESLQSIYEDYPMRVILIKRESDSNIKFDVFERLNTGAVNLNAQELRNNIYRGKYNDLINKLAEDKDFLSLLGLTGPQKRMQDKELLLRFFAFYHKTYLKYQPPMKQFLNIEMEDYRDLKESDGKELREIFKKCVDLSKTVFGGRAFRRFICGSEKDPNGRWEEKLNRALFDVVMFGFSRYEKRDVVPRSDAIQEELIWMMTHNDAFIDTMLYHTDKKENVEKRFKVWVDSLETIIGLPIKEPRVFSAHYKKQLWEANPTCAICNQRIQLPDDSEVDHIDFYWRGGNTIPSNARLVHRYCNRARGRA